MLVPDFYLAAVKVQHVQREAAVWIIPNVLRGILPSVLIRGAKRPQLDGNAPSSTGHSVLRLKKGLDDRQLCPRQRTEAQLFIRLVTVIEMSSPEVKPEIRLEIGHVLFIDIVGYSKLLITDQKRRKFY